MNVLIIEDEQLAAQRLEKMLVKAKPDINIVGMLDSVEACLHWLTRKESESVDLAFVDIQLGDGTSFEVFDAVEIDFPVVFTTAYDSYAIDAFQVHAIDYILKPVKQGALEEAIRKYEKYDGGDNRKLSEAIARLQGTTHKRRFVTKLGRMIKVLPIEEIAYFMTEHKISFAVLRDGKRYPLEYSLDTLEQMLDPQFYYRANRQFIIHIDSIKELHSYSKARLKVQLVPRPEQDVIVSTERSSKFKNWLAEE